MHIRLLFDLTSQVCDELEYVQPLEVYDPVSPVPLFKIKDKKKIIKKKEKI